MKISSKVETKAIALFHDLPFSPPGDHLTDAEFVAYASAVACDEDIERIDCHLASCSECAAEMERLVSSVDDWDKEVVEQGVFGIHRRICNALDVKVQEVGVRPKKRLTEHGLSDATAASGRFSATLRQLMFDVPDVRGHVVTDNHGIVDLLHRDEAIENKYDYVLPCGWHVDTFFNIGKLCCSEDSLRVVAKAFDGLFKKTEFDVVVAHGWAMATIARRLARMRESAVGTAPVKVVMAEGYDVVRLLEDLDEGSTALVLIDVAVSGILAKRMTRVVEELSANVAAIGCVVDTGCSTPTVRESYQSLCQVNMHVIDPAKEDCPRCGKLDRRDFNPIAYHMSVKATAPRSTAQFLSEIPGALEFWKMVQSAKAHECHRMEGDIHHLDFIDTYKLLLQPESGQRLVQRLHATLAIKPVVPDVIVVPHRKRAILLANMLAQEYRKNSSNRDIKIVVAKRRRANFSLSLTGQTTVMGRSVLVVDCAAGHGRTIDELYLLVTRLGAETVAGAVLLSRLSDTCEEALSHRLNGGFVSLFHLEERPVVIHGRDRSLCRYCSERATLQKAAEESRIDAVMELAEWRLAKIGGRKKEDEGIKRKPAQQLSLFDLPADSCEFLRNCLPSVASGAVLHALSAAANNGRSPTTLPEINDERIPAASRSLMIENLPDGVLSMNPALSCDFEQLLGREKQQSVWSAAAGILAREGGDNWLDHLGEFIERSPKFSTEPKRIFWNKMVWNIVQVMRQNETRRGVLREKIQDLVRLCDSETAERGLNDMLNALDSVSNPSSETDLVVAIDS